jgi:hypothetical protein
MDIINACILLEIDTRLILKITKVDIKKSYHKAALKYHPDKNGNTLHATQHFQEIQSAYSYLLSNLDFTEDELNTNTNTNEEDLFDTQYVYFLTMFLETIIKGNYKEVISNIIQDILKGYTISIKLFDELDRDTSFEIYNYLCKYKNILHINSNLIESVRSILIEKYSKDKIYILNPSLQDLFENNLYKLVINDNKYLVPLWHNELYFDYQDANDNDKSEIIVFCIPDLPEYISIDENNHLLVDFILPKENIHQLLEEEFIPIHLGNEIFKIPVSKLFIRKKQIHRFNKKGISQIIEQDMYNTNKKSDIIITINFV